MNTLFRIADVAAALGFNRITVKNQAVNVLQRKSSAQSRWRTFNLLDMVLISVDCDLLARRLPRKTRQEFRACIQDSDFMADGTAVLDGMFRSGAPAYVCLPSQGKPFWVNSHSEYRRYAYEGGNTLINVRTITEGIVVRLKGRGPGRGFDLPLPLPESGPSTDPLALNPQEQILLNRLRDTSGPILTLVKSEGGKIVSITDIATSAISCEQRA